MSLTGLVVLLFIVAAFGVLGAAVFWLALKDEDNRGRQDCVKWSKSPVSFASPPLPAALVGRRGQRELLHPRRQRAGARLRLFRALT